MANYSWYEERKSYVTYDTKKIMVASIIQQLKNVNSLMLNQNKMGTCQNFLYLICKSLTFLTILGLM
jgi:hypothetical protein